MIGLARETLLALVLVAGSACAQGVVLRRSEPPPVGEVVSMDMQGVTVGSGSVSPVLVPWGRVLSVDGGGSFDEIADLAWRAPLRVARGDTLTAEPMFERLVALLGESNGPTTAEALWGLMVCQRARGADALAVQTWSAWTDASSHRSQTPVYQPRGSGRNEGSELDQAFLGVLIATMPPIWPGSAEPSLLATQEIGAIQSRGDLLLAWYRSSARLAAGLPAEFPEVTSSDPAVLLVRDLVLAQSGQPRDARPARDRLLDRLDGLRSSWASAWIHAAVGRSLIAEPDRSAQELGVVHLLHVPAQWSVVTPGLARTSLADAAGMLEQFGDTPGQEAIEAELRRLRLASHSQQESVP